MSTFSKKYYAPKNQDKYIGVTWEAGYRNIQMRYNDRLIHSIKQPEVLIKGIKFEDEELGKIKIQFTVERPRKLEIKVNNKKYKTINKRQLGYEYNGLVTTFSALAIFAAMELFYFMGLINFDFSHPVVKTIVTVDLLIIIAYGLTSYFLMKRKPYVYFVGTTIFLITSASELFLGSFLWTSITVYISFVFRLAILTFILLQAKHSQQN